MDPMLDPHSLFWIAAACQCLGWTAMVVSRLGDRLVDPRVGRWCFFLAFALVGGCAGLIFCCHGGGWLTNGITLGAIAVGATLDLSPRPEPAPF